MTQAPPVASAPESELEKAKRERRTLQARLDNSVAAYETAETKLAKTRDLLEASQFSLAASEQEVVAAQTRIGLRANLIYREGGVNVFEFLFRSQTVGDLSRRLKLVSKVSREESAYLTEIQRARTKTNGIRRELAARAREERELVMELGTMSKSLSGRFAEASRLEKKLLAEEQAKAVRERERKAKAAAVAAATAAANSSKLPTPKAPALASKQPSPAPTLKGYVPYVVPTRAAGGMHCPVDGPNSFTDTWGQPREGGRRHEGVDMFAAQGTPTVAATDAVVHKQSSGGAGGLAVELKGVNGTHYYYAHLSKFAGLSVGQKVSAGAIVGYVGTTGNASRTAPHLHFEVHPGGGGPVNPYASVKSACGR